MTGHRLALLLLPWALLVGPAAAQDDPEDAFHVIHESRKEVAAVDRRLADNASPPAPQERTELEKRRAENVGTIESTARSHPQSGPVNFEAGSALLSVNEPKKALPFADRAVELAPEEPNVRVLRGQTHYKLGDYEKASEDAKKALELDPGNKMAQALYSLTAGRAGRGAKIDAPGLSGSGSGPPGAGAGPRGGGAAAPAPQTASVVAAPAARPQVALSSADRLKAAGLYRDALGKLKLGDAAAAKDLLGRAAELDPENAKVRAAKAKAHLAAKEFKQALAEAEQAVRLGPKEAAALLVRGQAKEGLGLSPVDFLPDMKAAAQLDPSLSGVYENAMAKYRSAMPVEGSAPAPGAVQAGPVAVRGPAPPIKEGESTFSIGGWRIPMRYAGWALVGMLGLGALAAYAMLRAWRGSLDVQ